MKITIDTEQKTIKLEGQIKLSELIDELADRCILIDEYSLIGTEKVVEYYPAPIPVYPVYPSVPMPTYPVNPWEGPIITYKTSLT